MNEKSRGHLDPDRMAVSVVDARELTVEEREHLEACAECSRQRERLLSSLGALSRDAAGFTPGGPKRVVLPSEAYPRPMARLMSWSMGFAGAAALVVLAGVYLLARIVTGPVQEADMSRLAMEAHQDKALLAEVQKLEDDPLPEPYAGIIPEPAGVPDDEFFDFLIPPDGGPKGGKT